MVNVIPDSEVVIGNLQPNHSVAVEIDQHGAEVDTIQAEGGVVTIPDETFVDAYENRLSLRLIVDGDYHGGTISFLPVEESESYDLVGYYNKNGALVDSQYYRSTKLVSVEDVEDIVISAYTAANARALVCYDADENFVSVLLDAGEFVNRHIVPDGSYRYIASSCLKSWQTASLVLHFRRRRR